jgi:O-antigen ligase
LGALVFSGYGIAAYTGRLGDRAAEKYIAQSESSFGLLFGGRGDFLAGLLAVQASPIFGHGTWKSDVKGYRFQAAHIIGMEYFAMEDGSGGRVGGHSNILEAWAEHGVLAVLFWVYLFYFIIRCLSTGIYYHFALLGPLLFLLYSRIWDFFFSPINGRTSLAFTFALFILVVLRAERLSRAPPPSINLPPLGDRLVSPQGPSNLSSPARRSVP